MVWLTPQRLASIIAENQPGGCAAWGGRAPRRAPLSGISMLPPQKRDHRVSNLRWLAGAAAMLVLIAAVASELRKQPDERERHGVVGGVMPYDFRCQCVSVRARRIGTRTTAPSRQRRSALVGPSAWVAWRALTGGPGTGCHPEPAATAPFAGTGTLASRCRATGRPPRGDRARGSP